MGDFEENLKNYLSNNMLLENLAGMAARQGFDCWLVGGVLRDVLLGRAVADVDLVTTVDPTPLAKSWARQQSAHWFWLDKERCQSRVLLRYGKLEFYFDFAPLRAETLDQDLSLRDFTINALALPLVLPLASQNLYDLLDGKRDLECGLIRSCSQQSLADDPLRILKGIRHCVALDFQLAQETEAQMRELSDRLVATAAERKRNELGRIMSSDNLSLGVNLLERCQLLPVLFGPSGESFSYPDLMTELNSMKKTIHQWMKRESLAAVLVETYDEFIDRKTLYLLALFLRHYCSKESADFTTDRLRFSSRATTVIETLVVLDFETLAAEFNKLPDNSRVRVLWLERLGPASIDQMLFYAALKQPDDLKISAIQQLLDDYLHIFTQGRVADLLTGREIKKLLPDISGKQIGLYKEKIKEAEISGVISHKTDAKNLICKDFSIDKI